jgi:hypothetical protein
VKEVRKVEDLLPAPSPIRGVFEEVSVGHDLASGVWTFEEGERLLLSDALLDVSGNGQEHRLLPS